MRAGQPLVTGIPSAPSARGPDCGPTPTATCYHQTVPMTDLALFPHAKVAAWPSGFSTLAMSGATFLRGKAWGPWEGALAVGLLTDSGVLLLRIGTLYLTTSNEGGTDGMLEVGPL